MKRVFADTFFLVALLDRTDAWHERARLASLLLENTVIVTSDAVIVEFVNFFSNHNAELRQRVVRQVHLILGAPEFQVHPMTRSAMMAGLSLHASRSDKHYSLTDCISMQMMRELGLLRFSLTIIISRKKVSCRSCVSPFTPRLTFLIALPLGDEQFAFPMRALAPPKSGARVRLSAMRKFFCLLVLLALFSSGVARADELTTETSVSSRLSALSKLPVAAQQPEIGWVYYSLSFLIWATSLRDGGIGIVPFGPTRPKEELSASERLNLAVQILREHPDSFAKLVHADLTTEQTDIQELGLKKLTLVMSAQLSNVSARPAQSLALSRTMRDTIYQDLAAIFRAEPGVKGAGMDAMFPLAGARISPKARAELALAQLGDARAIALLIEDDPTRPTRNWMSISGLALQNPTDPALQKLVPLLFSPDAEVRSEAMVALPVSLPAVYQALPMLLNDASSGVRYFAVSKAFQLPEDQFAPLENQLKTKLADAAENVKLEAALGFAARENPLAAPILLVWLRAHPDAPRTQDVSDALNHLIGFDAGYKAIYQPTPEIAQRNTEAFGRIEAWITAHPAN